MKNAFVALALVLIVSSASAALDSNTKNRLQKISATPFGKTILETIQVELQSKGDPRPRIVELLNDLEAELIQDQAQADATHQGDQDNHDAVDSAANDELDTLAQSIADNTQSQSDLTASLGQDNADLTTQQGLLDSYNTELSNANDAREESQRLWQSSDNKAGHIIDVLGQVRNVITQRLANRYNSQFLQTAHKEILGSFAQVKQTIESKKFKKLSPGFAKLASFLASKVEAHLRQDDDAEDEEAEAALTAIVTVIDNIVSAVEADRQHAADLNDEAVQAYNDNVDRLNGLISLTSSNIDNLSNEITQLGGQLDNVNADLDTENTRVGALNDQITTEDAAFAELDAAYTQSTHDRSAELEAIQEVLQIVQNQLEGLRQYSEDYLANN